MSAYSIFAHYYDLLTDNVRYADYAKYIDKVFKEHNIGGIILDAGCGTGTMLSLLSERGYDMIGVDIDEEMLSEAFQKCPDALLLRQDIAKLDLFGTIRGAVSTLDVVNHMDSTNAVENFFSRVALFMEPDGIFIFDMNLPYKHDIVLADNAFVFEFTDGMLVWQNKNESEKKRIKMTLDLYLKDKGTQYIRSNESFYEYTYGLKEIEKILNKCGFEIIKTADGEEFTALGDSSQRAVITAKRK